VVRHGWYNSPLRVPLDYLLNLEGYAVPRYNQGKKL
jgi:hypothetical protein